MSDPVPTQLPVTAVSAAIAKLCSLWCGAITLTLVFLIGIACGVEAPTALLRAGIAFVVGLVLGRWLGTYLGRHLAPALVKNSPPGGGA